MKSFFKPTILYKEFIILDMIEKNPNVTQREIGKELKVAVSMINMYIDTLENEKKIYREYISSKEVHYHVTKYGIERRKLLNIEYFQSSLHLYESAKSNLITFVNHLVQKKFKYILLYGAGEVAEFLIHGFLLNEDTNIEIVAIIDDDPKKIGSSLLRTPIVSINEINRLKHDCILLSSYTHSKAMINNLKSIKYDSSRIVSFF
jgi:FlaA1/EpsC-like NDP-sugar epimerase